MARNCEKTIQSYHSFTNYICKWYALYCKYSIGFNYKDALLTPKMLIFYQSKKIPVDIIYIINEFCLDRPNKLFNEKWYYAVSQKNLMILGISNYLYNRKNNRATRKKREILRWYRKSLKYR